ncbi:MAG TPA: OmpA family protein, partial [Stellaceae bacterium]|nr:OmpA family protein [Stellaceae bacterium]
MRRVLAVLLLATLAACSRDALFVVLPNPDGTAGQVTIEKGDQSVVLNKPYAAGEVRGSSASSVAVDQGQVNQIFGQAIAARPILPSHFRLYFISDSDQLTPDSEKLYQDVFGDIKRRPVYQVEVIGHTDTLGDKAYNQHLSLERANAIRDRLVKDGLSASAITTAGRGQLDLAVPEPPN